MQSKLPRRLLTETYLAMARDSVGSRAYRHSYALIGGRKRDLVRGGELSCAYFVSALLNLFHLIRAPHLTVDGLERDLCRRGWRKTKRPRPGSVIFWKAKTFEDGEWHRHVGIYLGDGRAVSNSAKRRVPVSHDWKKRQIQTIYWHKKLSTYPHLTRF